jgi:methionine-rich copper-binding protein CopC
MKTLTLAIALVVMLLPVLGHAHAKLGSSLPADGESLQTPPKELVLHFSEAVRLTALTITREGAASQKVDSLPSTGMKDFAIAAPALETGRYSVSWRALAADSHVMTGTFVFTVGSQDHAGHAQH